MQGTFHEEHPEHISQSAREDVAASLKQIWLKETADEARETAKAFIEKYGKKYPAASACLEEGLEDSLRYYAFPTIDAKKTASSNMIERLNKEIQRRTKVVGIFPNESSYIRLVTAALMEYADDWSIDSAYNWRIALSPRAEKGSSLRSSPFSALSEELPKPYFHCLGILFLRT